jgi:hypothetical protein
MDEALRDMIRETIREQVNTKELKEGGGQKSVVTRRDTPNE